MSATIKDLFKISASDSKYFNDEQDKFELVSCPISGKNCKQIRAEINKDYRESQLYHRDKIYQKSIDLLKNAYNSTLKLKEPSCANCAELFRSSISQSMQVIHKEQQRKSTGLFGLRLPQINFLKLDNAVKEI